MRTERIVKEAFTLRCKMKDLKARIAKAVPTKFINN